MAEERIVMFTDPEETALAERLRQQQMLAEAEQAAKKPKARAEAKPVTTYRKLISFGKLFEVEKDEDYKAAAMTFSEEAGLIARMRQQLAEDGMTVKKEYVKGRENICVHPLIQEIPKHVDCANRTLKILSDILVARGKRKIEEVDGLTEFKL